MKGRTRWAFAVVAVVLTLTGAAVPVAVAENGGQGDRERRGGQLDVVRNATRRFHDVDKAIDAGYVQFFGCVHEPLAGSMGIHFVNGTLANDAVIDLTKPEALTYEIAPNGELALVGVEYVVFQKAWDAANHEPPSLFGHPFVLVPEANRYGIPAFYALHAWAWKSNPTGPFKDWNPAVLCLDAEGHQH